MTTKEAVIDVIHRAFDANAYPGDDFLLGAFDGREPEDEVAAFRGLADWTAVEAEFLDDHPDALSFFSEAGFHFFLPAYMTADARGALHVADTVFHLTSGFHDEIVEIPTKRRVFVVRTGKSAFINPRRFGAMTFFDYARYRLSIFAREEVGAIVAYLEYKREHSASEFEKERIITALDGFWRERARSAPGADSLKRHLDEQAEYLDALRDGIGE
ncbi:MAG: hypothetical protein OEO21_05265 [Candidatus Krumholzibacteria bacterium]|nr:hypothetical protein [Candidatus Krumholzibacteria bacterium]